METASKSKLETTSRTNTGTVSKTNMETVSKTNLGTVSKSQITAENPLTAVASRTEPPTSPPVTPAKYKRRRKREKDFKPDYDIPGVFKITLSEDTQHAINCVAGDSVTAEKPWLNVDRELVLNHLDNYPENSEFLPIKKELVEYPREDILMGYIPDVSKDDDEFYICVTDAATNSVNEMVEKVRQVQERKLKNAVVKKIRRWKSLGSEQEVNGGLIKYNRNLLEVEIESKYPILPFKVHFRSVKTQDLKDAYMELRPTDETLSTIVRRRVDAFAQVTPAVECSEAQTTCTYPSNSYTQYEYEIPEVDSEATIKVANDFFKENLDSLCDILRVNSSINLYSNDYEDLVINPSHCRKPDYVAQKEYICFIDMKLCKSKMISAISWHPMWTGCVVLAYAEIAPSLYLSSKPKTDEVYAAVHYTDPILFWSFEDNLKPKLILETPRPVYSLSCCPYDPNLIIGGLVNGQIILWDITNKLNAVEEEEVLSIEQQKYRDYMFSLMNWMKNIFDLARVRAAALSDLKYSHQGSVCKIWWMSPFHTISNTGKISENAEEAPHSLQFITTGEDGSILIWDLLKEPTKTPGGFRGMRKMKRLKRRPSALSVMESPFRQLHLKLRPVYRINITHPFQGNRSLRICSSYFSYYETEYELADNKIQKKLKLNDRLIYRPVLHLYDSVPNKNLYLGTMEGDFIQATWEGHEFDSGEVVNFENSQFLSFGKFHDGPIVNVDYCSSIKTILTIGGRIFCLWREDFKNRPFLWRKCSSVYTDGSFFVYDPASLKFARVDGYTEQWTLFYRSKVPVRTMLASNGACTAYSTHVRKIRNNVYGMGDYTGCLRLFYREHIDPLTIRTKTDAASAFMTKEIERKKEFLQWQSDWNKFEAAKKVVQTVETKEEERVFETKPKVKKEVLKPPTISPGQRYKQMILEERRVKEQERIKSIILTKKQLDTEEMLKRREPLRKLEEENEIKRRKQKTKLKDSDNIFRDTVAMLFPDVVKEKPPIPPDPYKDSHSEYIKKEIFSNYQRRAIDAQDFVEENPFSCDFSWKSTLIAGRDRRKKLDESIDKAEHWRRYASTQIEKEKKVEDIEVGEEIIVSVVPRNEEIEVTEDT